jgi:hypothetical protein
MMTSRQRAPAMPMTSCRHQLPCPPAGRTDRLAAAVIAAHPEQGWSLLCNGVITFDDTGAIAAGHIILPRRAATRPPRIGARNAPAALPGRSPSHHRGKIMQAIVSFYLTSMAIAAAVALYMLPTLVAWLRHAPDLAATAVVNVALGWTFVGWIAALAMALRAAHPPVVQSSARSTHRPTHPIPTVGCRRRSAR